MEAFVGPEDVFDRDAVVSQHHGVHARVERGVVKELGGGARRRLDPARLQVEDAHRAPVLALLGDGFVQTDLARPHHHRDQFFGFRLDGQRLAAEARVIGEAVVDLALGGELKGRHGCPRG